MTDISGFMLNIFTFYISDFDFWNSRPNLSSDLSTPLDILESVQLIGETRCHANKRFIPIIIMGTIS